MRIAVLPSLALLALAPAHALAQAPAPTPALRVIVFSAHLDLHVDEGAKRCPDAAYLRKQIAEELGYDPFALDREGVPAGGFTIAITRVPKGLHATTDHVDAAGVKQWTKTYDDVTTTRAACESVMKGVALQIETELTRFEDAPAAAPAPAPPPPPPAPPPPAPPPEPAPEPPPPEPPASHPLHPQIEIGGGAYASFGVGPGTAFGGQLHLGVALYPFVAGAPWLSFAVEGRGDGAPAHEVTGGYGVTTSLLGGSLLACLHEGVLAREGFAGSFFLCPMGTVGSVRSSYEGGAMGLATGRGFYAGAGARLGFEGRLGPSFALRLHGAGLGTLHGATGTAGAQQLWQTSGGAFEVGLAALFSFEVGAR